jgi:hypothetical protein
MASPNDHSNPKRKTIMTAKDKIARRKLSLLDSPRTSPMSAKSSAAIERGIEQ